MQTQTLGLSNLLKSILIFSLLVPLSTQAYNFKQQALSLLWKVETIRRDPEKSKNFNNLKFKNAQMPLLLSRIPELIEILNKTPIEENPGDSLCQEGFGSGKYAFTLAYKIPIISKIKVRKILLCRIPANQMDFEIMGAQILLHEAVHAFYFYKGDADLALNECLATEFESFVMKVAYGSFEKNAYYDSCLFNPIELKS